MSGEEDPAAWLRRQIEVRLALAREAGGNTDGRWWRCTTGTYTDRGVWTEDVRVPAGPLYGGGAEQDSDGDIFGGEQTVIYDEGYPTDEQFGHIEANDPRDTIARCEAELAILDEHRVARMTYPDVASFGCIRCHYGANGEDYNGGWCTTTRLLASGYRHHDGYAEHWGDQG
jgi:hypothetical protein